MTTWRMGSTVVAVGLGAALLASAAPAVAHVQAAADGQLTKQVQVEVLLLSATGTITTSVQGTYDHPYIYVEDPNTGDRQRAMTASMNSTVTWKAPKQALSSMQFGAQGCEAADAGCRTPIHKVTGSAQGTATASYADGSSINCTVSEPSLASGSEDMFTNFDDGFDVMMVRVGGTKVKIWLGGAASNFGLDAENCPTTAGLTFTNPRDVAQTIPNSKFTGAKIGKPFTLTLVSVSPITGKTGDTVNQVGTVTETTTLKVKVTGKF